MNVQSAKGTITGHTDEQWQARIDLAAAHRCAVMHNLHEGIFNHLTLRVPGKEGRYYQIPWGLHWSEVTASSLVLCDAEGNVLEGDNEVEDTAFFIHSGIHYPQRWDDFAKLSDFSFQGIELVNRDRIFVI